MLAQELEQEMRKAHFEDMKAQMTAHKMALQTSQETAEQQLKMRLREAEDKFKQQHGNLFFPSFLAVLCGLIR